jgi:hypothetical protein
MGEECPPEAIGEDYWLRPVDPPGSEAHMMAFYDRRAIHVVSLPGGALLSRWVAGGYVLMPVGWSPDGRRLAAIGLPLAGSRDALFVIEVG